MAGRGRLSGCRLAALRHSDPQREDCPFSHLEPAFQRVVSCPRTHPLSIGATVGVGPPPPLTPQDALSETGKPAKAPLRQTDTQTGRQMALGVGVGALSPGARSRHRSCRGPSPGQGGGYLGSSSSPPCLNVRQPPFTPEQPRTSLKRGLDPALPGSQPPGLPAEDKIQSPLREIQAPNASPSPPSTPGLSLTSSGTLHRLFLAWSTSPLLTRPSPARRVFPPPAPPGLPLQRPWTSLCSALSASPCSTLSAFSQ